MFGWTSIAALLASVTQPPSSLSLAPVGDILKTGGPSVYLPPIAAYDYMT